MTGREQDKQLAEFQPAWPRLFGIAYRMLGTVAEAEDVVQDAWLRWQGTDQAGVREPAAFLATTVTRLAINALHSARARRETYLGPWLPEPVATGDDPTLGAERAEALELAVLLLLERLSPTERAAYVLHEAFGYPYRQIAELLETSEANARQLARRARTRVTQGGTTKVSLDERNRLLEAFLTAAREGNLVILESLLAQDVVSISDGGGVVSAARVPVRGRSRVARFVLGVLAKFGQGIVSVPVEVNGQTAVLGVRDGRPVTLWALEIGPQGVQRLLIVANPDKLQRLAGLAPRGSGPGVTFRHGTRS